MYPYIAADPPEGAAQWIGSLNIVHEKGDLLNSIIEEYIDTLIVTDGNTEEILDQYIENRFAAGGDAWIEQATEAYEAALVDWSHLQNT